MNDKRIIENYKTVRAVEKLQPDPSVQMAARNDLIRMINDAWVEAKANPAEVRDDGLRQLRAIIDNEKNPVKKQIHEMLYGIASRIGMTNSKTVLTVSDDASQVEQANEPLLPLPERIRFLKNRN